MELAWLFMAKLELSDCAKELLCGSLLGVKPCKCILRHNALFSFRMSKRAERAGCRPGVADTCPKAVLYVHLLVSHL